MGEFNDYPWSHLMIKSGRDERVGVRGRLAGTGAGEPTRARVTRVSAPRALQAVPSWASVGSGLLRARETRHRVPGEAGVRKDRRGGFRSCLN